MPISAHGIGISVLGAETESAASICGQAYAAVASWAKKIANRASRAEKRACRWFTDPSITPQAGDMPGTTVHQAKAGTGATEEIVGFKRPGTFNYACMIAAHRVGGQLTVVESNLRNDDRRRNPRDDTKLSCLGPGQNANQSPIMDARTGTNRASPWSTR